MRRAQVLFTLFGYQITLGLLLLILAYLSQALVAWLASTVLQKELAFLKHAQSLVGA